MTTEQALAFLQAHQPMPDDQDLSEALIRTYDEVRQFFMVLVSCVGSGAQLCTAMLYAC